MFLSLAPCADAHYHRYAVSAGAREAMEELLRLKADPFTRGADGSSVLQLAVLNCPYAVVASIVSLLKAQLLTRDPNDGKDDRGAVDAGSTSAFQQEVEHVVQASGDAALHFAVERGDVDILRLILRSRGDIGARNADGCTPLFAALAAQQYDLVLAMREAVLNHAPSESAELQWYNALTMCDNRGTSPIHLLVGNYFGPAPARVLGQMTTRDFSAVREWEDQRATAFAELLGDAAEADSDSGAPNQLGKGLALAYRLGLPKLVHSIYTHVHSVQQARGDSARLGLDLGLRLPGSTLAGEGEHTPQVRHGELSDVSRVVLCGRFDLLVQLISHEGSEVASGHFLASADNGRLLPSARKLSQRLFAFPLDFGLALAQGGALPSSQSLIDTFPSIVDDLSDVFKSSGISSQQDTESLSVRQRVSHLLVDAFEVYARTTLMTVYEEQAFALQEEMALKLLFRASGAVPLVKLDEVVAVNDQTVEMWLLADVLPCLALHREYGRTSAALLSALSTDASDATVPMEDLVIGHLRSVGRTAMAVSYASFFAACEMNDFAAVAEQLLRSGEADEAVVGKQLRAATSGAGIVDINRENEDGYTGLMLAASFGNNEVLQVLLELKADLRAVSSSDHASALLLASANGNGAGVQNLLAHARSTAMSIVEQSGQKLFWDDLLGACTEPGKSALYFAAQDGHVECLKLLLDAKSTFHKRAVDGSTPLTAAAASGHPVCVRLLLEESSSRDDDDDNDAECSLAQIVSSDADALLRHSIRRGDAFLRTVVLETDPDAIDRVDDPALVMSAFGMAIDTGDMNFLSFLLESQSGRDSIQPDAQDAIDLSAWGEFGMLMVLHEAYDLPEVLGSRPGALQEFDGNLKGNFGVEDGLRRLLNMDPDVFLHTERDDRSVEQAAELFTKHADAEIPASSVPVMTVDAFVSAVGSLPAVAASIFRDNGDHQDAFLRAGFERASGIEGTGADLYPGMPTHLTQRAFTSVFMKISLMSKVLPLLRE